jgi:predicted transcriptional regulator
MKTVTLKTDELFFEKITALADHLHVTKSELIRRSIVEYERYIEKKELKEQMKRASMRVRGDNAHIIEDFDTSSGDGLGNV